MKRRGLDAAAAEDLMDGIDLGDRAIVPGRGTARAVAGGKRREGSGMKSTAERGWKPPADYVQPSSCPQMRTAAACQGGRPKVVFLLVARAASRVGGADGSIERKAAAQEITIEQEVTKGRVIILGSCIGTNEALEHLSRNFKQHLEDIRLYLVDLANEVFVFNPDGGLGDKSTQNVVAYALASKKQVRTLKPVDLEVWLAERRRWISVAAMKNVEPTRVAARRGKATAEAE